MNKAKLNFRFHNPNTIEETADYIRDLFIEVNQKKVERIIQEAAGDCKEQGKEPW